MTSPPSLRSPLARAAEALHGLPAPSTYVHARRLFLRALAAVFLVAFASLAVQIEGLVGSRGILPAADFLARARQGLGDAAYWQVPTLAWLDAGDGALRALALAGVVVSALGVVGLLPLATAALSWLLYLSLASVGGTFMNFQWDALLLEAGLLAILLAPPVAWLGRAGHPSGAPWLLARFLLFKLMLLSGAVKLLWHDPTWLHLTALDYHYWTQPLPAWTSWYAHFAPPWMAWASIRIMFFIELAVPFAFFGPRRARLFAFVAEVALQLMIAATGNYGFFNLLTIVLCLPLLDDATLLGLVPRARRPALPERAPRPAGALGLVARVAITAVCLPLFALSFAQAIPTLLRGTELPPFLDETLARLAPLRSINNYGLFRSMTTERAEIVVEGSDDKTTWKPYEFKWKPGRLDRAPTFIAPHMPRLDWQMWFAALSDCDHARWFIAFQRRLLEGAPAVLGLLEPSPFGDRPPRYLRTRMFQYRFATPAERAATGEFWRRDLVGPYCPSLRLDGEKLVKAE